MKSNDKQIQDAKKKWEETTVARQMENIPERFPEFRNTSGIEIKRIYTPEDNHLDYLSDLGFPGEYPYIRGVDATGYRARIWTRRPITGFQSAEETNKRFKFLLKQGQTGLHFVFDMPTLAGFDSDNPLAEGEVGLGGMAIDSLADFEVLLEGIRLDEVSVSYSHWGPVIMAMLLAVAERQGVPFHKLRGTTQNDVLMYYHSCHFFDLPIQANMTHFVDLVEFCTKEMPQWYTVSISGYNCREGGCSAVQEMAFAFGDAMEYMNACLARGLKIDDFVRRFAFMLNGHMDFFEEICKYRAMRRMWAKLLHKRYGATDPRALKLRFHTQTSGASLTAQRPLNNITRGTIEALAAVLGGTQSLHVSCYDECFSVPSQQAAQASLDIQQIIAYETGIASTVDPLAGSYYVENLTNEMEMAAWEILTKIDEQGGMLKASLSGWVQQEKANYVAQLQRELAVKQRIIVGVNEFKSEEALPISIFRVSPDFEQKKIEALKHLRRNRDNAKVNASLNELTKACSEKRNTIPPTLEAVKSYATFGEIYDAMRLVYGSTSQGEMISACVNL